MRIPSGVTDQYIYFVAVDATDLKTRETGLSSFTVYRSRNGGAAAAYTTPTVNETDTTNMPGVYELLLDEDMTLDAGDQSQEVVLHITQASMAPVTRVFELYRPSVTAGETIGVSSGAVSNVTTAATATAVTTVNGLAANVITAASIATGAIDADAIADGAIDAGAFAADAITAAKVAADVGTEIGTAVWATATRVLTANTNLNDPTAAAIADAVWDEDATAHQTQGTFGQAIGDPAADTNTIYGAVVTGAAGATVAADIIAIKAETAAILDDTDDIGVAGAGLTAINLPDQTMNITGDITGNLSGSVGSVTGAVGSVTGNVGGNVTGTIGGLTAAALKDFFDTDSATTYASAVAGSVVKEIADNAGGGTPPTAAAIADAVWDEALAGHAGAGSAGEALSAAGTAGDPWTTALPGAYGAGTAGKIIGDNINATISSRATQTSVDTIDDLIDTEIGALTTAVADLPTNAELATALGTADDAVLAQIALVKAQTDLLPSDPADASVIAGRFDTLDTSIADLPTNAELATALGTADDAVLAQVALVKAKTDSLTFTVAGQVDANIKSVAGTTVTGVGTEADPWGP